MAWPLSLAFVGTSGTTLSEHDANWSLHPVWSSSQPLLTSNRLRGNNGTTTAVPLYADAPTGADYEVEADLYIVDTNTTHNAGVGARWHSTASTGYIARYRRGTGINLFNFVAGTQTTLGTVAGDYAVGTTLNLRLRCEGSSIKVFANDTEVISVTDSAVTAAGQAAMWILGNSGTGGVHIVNFSASMLSLTGDVNLAASGAAVASGTADITSSGGVVSISIPVLADFATGVDITDETGVTAIINAAADGAYVGTVTGLAPGATPTALTHGSLVDGSLYQVTLLLSGNRRAYLTATASAS